MIESEGIHDVFRMCLVVDGEIGADEPMIGKVTMRDLLPPFRRIVSDGFGEGRGYAEQADNGVDRKQCQAGRPSSRKLLFDETKGRRGSHKSRRRYFP